MSSKISIITIAFNNEQDIRRTIESVVGQTYLNTEYIIVDGKSTDDTLGIVKEYSASIAKIISEPDEGIYDAINKGIKLATGDIVGLVHAGDALFNNEVLSKIAKLFYENEIDASYGHSIIVNSKGRIVRVNKSPKFRKTLFRMGWMPSHQSIYIKRDLVDRLGYYRVDLGGSGDYEFVLRYFYFTDLRVQLLDDFIIRFYLGGISTSNYRRLLRTQRTHVKCWELNGESPPIYMIPLKLLRKGPQFLRAIFRRW